MVARSMTRSFALAALLTMGGCYTYAPMPMASLSPGVQARLRLNPEGFGQVVNQAAMSRVPAESLDLSARGLVGRVVVAGVDNVTVQLRGVGGAVFDAQVPVSTIEESALRQFSGKRTLLATGAVAALLTASFASGWIGGTTSSQPPSGGDDFAPGFSLPFSIGFGSR